MVHGPSGAEIVTDAPVDNHGKGESFSPTDLMSASLGVCMVTIMGIWAARNGVDLGGTSFTVEKEMSTTPPRKVAALNVRIHVPAKLPPETRERIEAAGRACPVHHSLHPDVRCDIAFTWG
jgi:putative redox protein